MFQRIIPSGGARKEFKFGLNLEDMDVVMRQVDRLSHDFQLPITFEDPVPHCTVRPEYRHYLTRCEWGYTKGSVNHKGELNRCGADDHYRLGSIFDGSLQTKWRTHEILVSFRGKKYLPDECQRCDLLEQCGGGCPLSCGTHQDHSLDLLYLQRKEKEATGRIDEYSRPPSPAIKDGIRKACSDDWTTIVQLEHEIFPDALGLFTPAVLERLYSRYPTGISVAVENGHVVGYAASFPLNATGVNSLVNEGIFSVCDLPAENIATSFEDATAVFVEVIAFAPRLRMRYRIGLWRWLLKILMGMPSHFSLLQ